jgi:hypothetical protein
MKNFDLTKTLLLIILILVVGSMIKDAFFKDNSEFEKLREEIVRTSKLVELTEGRYEKLLNDYNSEKDLIKRLQETNELLYLDIARTNEKVISVTRAFLKFKSNQQDLELDEPIEDLITRKDSLHFYYPSKDSSLVKHTIKFVDSTRIKSFWSFKPTPLDLVITETSEGIYKTNIGTNPWVSVTSLEVNTLPFETEEDRFGWSYGAGIWKSPLSLGIDLYGGVRLGEFNILLRVQPASDPQLGLMLLYNNK